MKQLIKAIGYLSIYVIVYIIILAISFFAGAVFEIDKNNINTNITVIASIIITVFLYSRIVKKETNSSIFNNCKFTLSFIHIFVIIVIGISFNFIVTMIINTDFIKNLFTSHNPKVRDIATKDNLFLTIINTGLFVPFFEELLFRDLIYSSFKERFSVKVSIILQAVLFAVIHFNLLQIIYCFILGVLLGLIYEKTKTLISTIILHASISISSIIIMNL